MDRDDLTAVRVLAEALDNLGARIHRDLPSEGNYVHIADPQLERELSNVVTYADTCLEALDHPAVKAALSVKGA